jgi:hypothetical protein
MALRRAFLRILFLPRAFAIFFLVAIVLHADDASLISSRASLFLGASQHLRGERAKGLGWKPRPVVLEDWANEGITSVLAKVSN